MYAQEKIKPYEGTQPKGFQVKSMFDGIAPSYDLLNHLLQRTDAAADQAVLFRQICLIGAYIKRRCNLRLIEQSDGIISAEDLELSFQDLMECLSDLRVETELSWGLRVLPSPGFALQALDTWEFLIEYERFGPRSVKVSCGADALFCIDVRSAGPLPGPELLRAAKGGVRAECSALPGGYRVRLHKEER